jgi:nitrate reductase gamma subunit
MSEFLHTAIFGVYPYICLAVLAVGSVIRYDREPYSWRAGSSQLLRRKQLIMGSVLFHVGILVIFAGHFVGLLTPIAVFDALGVPHSAKQMLAIVAGAGAGGLALIGATLLLHRRFSDSRIRATSSFADNGILVLLYIQLLLGLGTIFISLNHLDGHEMVTFMSWAQGIFTLDLAASSYIAHAHWLFKAHLFLGLTIFLLFPFTRLVHMFSAPVRFIFRSGYQVVRRKPARGESK